MHSFFWLNLNQCSQLSTDSKIATHVSKYQVISSQVSVFTFFYSTIWKHSTSELQQWEVRMALDSHPHYTWFINPLHAGIVSILCTQKKEKKLKGNQWIIVTLIDPFHAGLIWMIQVTGFIAWTTNLINNWHSSTARVIQVLWLRSNYWSVYNRR